MNITVRHTTFDRVLYDEGADVLYLHVGDPTQAVAFGESPEGHALRYGPDGELVGLSIVNAKRLLDDAKPIMITISERMTIDPAMLASVVNSPV
jgi:uncharacterized protein YuzE